MNQARHGDGQGPGTTAWKRDGGPGRRTGIRIQRPGGHGQVMRVSYGPQDRRRGREAGEKCKAYG